MAPDHLRARLRLVTTVDGDHRQLLHAEMGGGGPRLVLVHGFTQNRRCWGPIADDLARDHEVVRLDAPGHGGSSDVRTDLPAGAELIAARGGTATYVGYSMGGRFVLHVALARPELVLGLVLIGATAGIDDHNARAERRHADHTLADRLERDGLETFLDGWLGQPMFAGLTPEMQFRDARRENPVAGLADSLRRAGTGSQASLWARLPELSIPVLLLAGAEDAKYAAEAHRMASSIGENAVVALVAGAGHAAHLEQPAETLAVLRPWLADNGL
jgi:2-succinyl-6-hydroxy-2,4-cyclohexadiene-1-carboxylate synthase